MHITLSALNVMVVDDEDFSRAMVVRLLRKLKIEKIREAVDGHQALNDLRALGHVDCVFLDFKMPTLNGLEVLKGVRDGTAGVDRSTSIAMLTAHNDLRLARTAIALDVSAFLSKPASLEVVKDRLCRIMATRFDVKSADIYAAVPLPRNRLTSEAVPVPVSGQDVQHTFAFAAPSPAPDVRPPGLLMKLELIPPNARISKAVVGPDGCELLPMGTVLSKRLLTYLYDLHALDECVAELWVELDAASLHQTCVGRG